MHACGQYTGCHENSQKNSVFLEFFFPSKKEREVSWGTWEELGEGKVYHQNILKEIFKIKIKKGNQVYTEMT